MSGGGEAPRRLLDARSRGARRAGRRAPAGRRRAATASTARSCPDRAQCSVADHGRHPASSGATAARTRSATWSTSPSASTTTQPRAGASSRYARADRGVERAAFAFEPVAVGTAPSARRRRRPRRSRRATSTRSGSRPAVATIAELLDHVDAEPAHHALVHERRRHVAVAHDPVTARRARARSRSRRAARGRPPSAALPRPGVDRLRRRAAAARGSPRRSAPRPGSNVSQHREPRPRSHVARRAACVLFPLPSPPSSTTNRPRCHGATASGAASSSAAGSASVSWFGVRRVRRSVTARSGRAAGTTRADPPRPPSARRSRRPRARPCGWTARRRTRRRA